MTFSARTLTYTIPLVTVLRKAGLFTFAGSLRSVEIEVINYPDCAFGASVMCFQIEICFSESAPSAPLMEFHRGLSAVKFAEYDGCDGAPIGIGLAVVSA